MSAQVNIWKYVSKLWVKFSTNGFTKHLKTSAQILTSESCHHSKVYCQLSLRYYSTQNPNASEPSAYWSSRQDGDWGQIVSVSFPFCNLCSPVFFHFVTCVQFLREIEIVKSWNTHTFDRDVNRDNRLCQKCATVPIFILSDPPFPAYFQILLHIFRNKIEERVLESFSRY